MLKLRIYPFVSSTAAVLVYFEVHNMISYVPTVFAWRRQNYSSATDGIPSPKQEATMCPWTNTLSKTRGNYSSVDEYHLQIMRQLFVRWTNALPKTWGKFVPWTNTLPKTLGRKVFVSWSNTLSTTWGKYSSHGRKSSATHGASIRTMNEYPPQHMGHVLARGGIAPIRRMDLAAIRQICSYSCGVCSHVIATRPRTDQALL